MLIKSIELTNFKSFKGKHTFSFFDSTPGLFLITGNNEVDSALGSNGAGKSSFIDAIKWVITGKTVRGLKAGDVHTRDVKGATTVKLNVVANDVNYEVFRSWSPNKLTIKEGKSSPVGVTQKEIDDLFVLSEDDIMNSVIFGQFNSSFLDLQPSQMLSVFNSILNLDTWVVKSDLCNKKSKNLQNEKILLENQLAHKNGVLEQLKESLNGIIESKDNFVNTQENEINQLKDKLSILLSNNTKSVSKPTNPINDDDEIADLNDIIEELNAENLDLNKKYSVLQNNYTLETNTLKKLKTLEGVCSNCGQIIDEGHIKLECSKTNKNLNEIKVTLEEINKQLDTNTTDLSYAKSLLNKHTVKQREAENLYQKAVSVYQDYLWKKEQKQKDIQNINEQIRNVQKRTNPFIQKLSIVTEEISEKDRTIKNDTLKIDDLSKIITMYDTWVKGFKEIRLLIIDQAIIDLEIEVNNAISDLGLHGWKISFDTERENKSGTISKGFTVAVHSPNNDATVPWAAWSGGEGQRLRLAAVAGLSSLIQNKKNVSYNVEFYDEPSKHMDKKGLTDLAEYLAERAKTQNKQIYLVDHNIPDFSGFTGALNIVKDNNGSKLLGELYEG